MQITSTVVGTLYCLFIAMSDVEEVKGAKPSALPSDLKASIVSLVQKEALTSGEFQTFASEFSVTEKTSAPVDDDRAKIVMGLINDKLPKMKLDELTEKYSRPENYEFLVAPKTNKAVWNQLRESTKKADNGMQKCQKMFMSSMYANSSGV